MRDAYSSPVPPHPCTKTTRRVGVWWLSSYAAGTYIQYSLGAVPILKTVPGT